jgi:hypothetical protein
MKIRELLEAIEKTGKLEKSAKAAMPGAESWPDLNQNNSAYLQYRYGIACAGSPDNIDMTMFTATHQDLVTIGYTQADHAILDAAAKALGVSPKRLTDPSSAETPDINKASPVAAKKKNKYGV